jgi:signal transduction histidine kinase
MMRMDELARAANGRLEVRSAPRAGTCVSAVFPLAK